MPSTTLPPHITHKPAVKHKRPINKSKTFCKRPSTRWGKDGKVNCQMHSGHTRQHINPYRNVTLPTCLRQNMPSASRVGTQGPLGHPAMEHGFEASQKEPTNPTGRVWRMDGEGLPQCQNLQGQNKTMARQKDQAESPDWSLHRKVNLHLICSRLGFWKE